MNTNSVATRVDPALEVALADNDKAWRQFAKEADRTMTKIWEQATGLKWPKDYTYVAENGVTYVLRASVRRFAVDPQKERLANA